MPIFYLDTSAIAKFYINEPGTEILDLLFQSTTSNDSYYTSFLTVLEFTAVVMRRRKSNVLSEQTANELINQFDEDAGRLFRIWPLSDSITTEAILVIHRHSLRTGDAIHLATALQIAAEGGDTETFMVSSDKELIEASQSSDMGTLDPLTSNSSDLLNQIRS